MASKTYFFKFESREECYEVCRSVGYCFTDPVTGDTVMDVPGDGHIDVAGQFYDPEKQPQALSPEGEMEPDPENFNWEPGIHLNFPEMPDFTCLVNFVGPPGFVWCNALFVSG